MTEDEWLACTDPTPMLDLLFGLPPWSRWLRTGPYTDEEEAALLNRRRMAVASDRKLRLFSCACCRRIWHLLTHPPSRVAVEVAERYADGLAAGEELASARDTGRPGYPYHSDPAGDPAVWAADPDAEAATHAWGDAAHFAAYVTCRAVPEEEAEGVCDAAWAENCRVTCDLLRDIFGNPFRPAAVDPDWLTPSVVELSRSIYDDRAFDRMPELADVLERAGCTNANVLEHCRGPGPHVRGCWIVDLLLGKE